MMQNQYIRHERRFLQRRLLRSLTKADMPGFMGLLDAMKTADRLAPDLLPGWTPEPNTANWDAAAEQLHAAIYSRLAIPANDPAHSPQPKA